MGLKTFPAYVGLVIVLSTAAFVAGDAEVQEIKNEFEHTKVLSQSLPLYNFKQPTLKDLQACEKLRDACIQNCLDTTCTEKCPICPIIIVQDHVIQGVNDTDLTAPASTDARQNVTTVIKVKNIVHNIMDTSAPNVNATNVNKINVYQKNETTPRRGGDFDLGETGEGPCCIAVLRRTCHMSWNGPSCHRPRQRMCGKQCTARVVHVDRSPKSKCLRIDYWPFVHCGRQNCDGCFDNIEELDGDTITLPKRCLACFEQGPRYPRSPMMPPPYYYPPPYGYYGQQMGYPGLGYGGGMQDDYADVVDENALDEANFNPDEWRVEAKKCKTTKDDGTVEIVDCTEEPIDDYPPQAYPMSLYDMEMGMPSARRRLHNNPSRRRRRRKAKAKKAAAEKEEQTINN